ASVQEPHYTQAIQTLKRTIQTRKDIRQNIFELMAEKGPIHSEAIYPALARILKDPEVLQKVSEEEIVDEARVFYERYADWGTAEQPNNKNIRRTTFILRFLGEYAVRPAMGRLLSLYLTFQFSLHGQPDGYQPDEADNPARAIERTLEEAIVRAELKWIEHITGRFYLFPKTTLLGTGIRRILSDLEGMPRFLNIHSDAVAEKARRFVDDYLGEHYPEISGRARQIKENRKSSMEIMKGHGVTVTPYSVDWDQLSPEEKEIQSGIRGDLGLSRAGQFYSLSPGYVFINPSRIHLPVYGDEYSVRWTYFLREDPVREPTEKIVLSLLDRNIKIGEIRWEIRRKEKTAVITDVTVTGEYRMDVKRYSLRGLLLGLALQDITSSRIPLRKISIDPSMDASRPEIGGVVVFSRFGFVPEKTTAERILRAVENRGKITLPWGGLFKAERYFEISQKDGKPPIQMFLRDPSNWTIRDPDVYEYLSKNRKKLARIIRENKVFIGGRYVLDRQGIPALKAYLDALPRPIERSGPDEGRTRASSPLTEDELRKKRTRADSSSVILPQAIPFQQKDAHAHLKSWIANDLVGALGEETVRKAALLHVDFHPDNNYVRYGEVNDGNVIRSVRDGKDVSQIWWLADEESGYGYWEEEFFDKIVLSVADLPSTKAPVILDIDLDYFVTRETYAEHPWTWPELEQRIDQFVRGLMDKKYDIVGLFIAVSPHYTIYFAQEIGDRLRQQFHEKGYRLIDAQKKLPDSRATSPEAGTHSGKSPFSPIEIGQKDDGLPFMDVLDEYWQQYVDQGKGGWGGQDGFIVYLMDKWNMGNSITALCQAFNGKVHRTTVYNWRKSRVRTAVRAETVEDILALFPHTKQQENRLWRLTGGDLDKSLKAIIRRAQKHISGFPIRKSRDMAAKIFSGLYHDLKDWSGLPSPVVARKMGVSLSLIGRYHRGAMPDHISDIGKMADIFIGDDAAMTRRIYLLMVGIVKEKTPAQLLKEVRDPSNPMTIQDMVYIIRLQKGENQTDFARKAFSSDEKRFPTFLSKFELGQAIIGDVDRARAMARHMGFTENGSGKKETAEMFQEVVDRLMGRPVFTYDPDILRSTDFSSEKSRSQALYRFEKMLALPRYEIAERINISREMYMQIMGSGLIKMRQKIAQHTSESLLQSFMEVFRIPLSDQDLFREFGGDQHYSTETIEDSRKIWNFLNNRSNFRKFFGLDGKRWIDLIQSGKEKGNGNGNGNGNDIFFDGSLVVVKQMGADAIALAYYRKKLYPVDGRGEIVLSSRERKHIYNMVVADVAPQKDRKEYISFLIKEIIGRSAADEAISEALRGAVTADYKNFLKDGKDYRNRTRNFFRRMGFRSVSGEVPNGFFET
ncbi:MAG TPA: hypothetical protein PKV41_03395, partial [Candidatus Omnitrophota bacterium]|nr:hypothetical protein [Candidatus Omnitrophota bacterium]